MTFDGIAITVDLDGGRIRHVAIDNRRLLAATTPLAGLPAGPALATLTRLFAVCRLAQGAAGLAALENAAGRPASPAQQQARRFLILGETVHEHCLQRCLHWPSLLGEAPLLGPLKGLRAALADLHRLLYPDGDWLRPGGGRLAPHRQALAGRLEAAAEALRLTADLAGRLRQKVTDSGLGDFGAAAVEPLPDLPADLLGCRLAGDPGFTARPDWLGRPCFTGPLARRPLFGTGLLAHLLAAEMDLAASLAEMRDCLKGLGDDAGQTVAGMDGDGMGIVEAARGRLVHRLVLGGGRVRDYRILAPTEWNFHPDGLLRLGLVGAPAPADAEFAIRLLITALDPCVDYQLTVRHA